MNNFEYIEDFFMLHLSASKYKIINIDNIKLAEEVLKSSDRKLSNNPNHTNYEDNILNISIGSEIEKLIKSVDELGKSQGLKTESAWGHIHQPLESTNTHNHDPKPYGWVYYVSAPQGSGDLTFWFFNKFRYSIKPEAGTLIVFPGWMDHCVSKNRGTGIRISISGNYINKQYHETI
jgi:hypothetical protein